METAGTVPVAIDVAGPVRTQLERVVEGALGWQVVAADDPVLPPRLLLVDPARAAAHAGGAVPLVLVTVPNDDPAVAARAAQHATAVLDGVPDATALRHLAARTPAGQARGRRPWCTVAAAAGGVGATTVATALAGLRAWQHGPTLLAASGPSHQDGTPAVAAADLASPAVWTAAVPAVGLEDLRVVRLRDAAVPRDAGPVPLVLERGATDPVDPAADVLVVRPDRAGLAAVAHGVGAVVLVVVVGRGAIATTEFERAAGGRPLLTCPWSARVAAAAAAGRLPADVPGSWLRPLAEVVAVLEDRAAVP